MLPLDNRTGELISSLSMISSVLTTVSATCLITLKIVVVTRRSHMRHSYDKIVEILVESAALVAVVALAVAIMDLVSFVHPDRVSTESGRLFYVLSEILGLVQTPIVVRVSPTTLGFWLDNTAFQGIGPTLIALRVTEDVSQRTSANSTMKTRPLSNLAFRRTTHNTSPISQDLQTVAQVSIVRHDLADGREHVSGIQPSIDVEEQDNNFTAQGTKPWKGPNVSSVGGV